jgi:hypothetical protein
MDTKNDTKKLMKQKLVLWKDKQDYKPWAKLTKRMREKTQINKIRNEKKNLS